LECAIGGALPNDGGLKTAATKPRRGAGALANRRHPDWHLRLAAWRFTLDA